ncbi:MULTISPECIES: ABC transporter permease [unclassified Pseudomonas]|uniref:ABC transporter permease n=1 Tax=unclassified Pseudomonas TaxID=196821 RepID=UPI000876A93C|nr:MULTISPECIES: ABC transporter permease [unclassified Pseudomonas]SCZ71417.1 peptide/nickel transport system permease protein [Pseudomonas sp. NFPP17]SDA74783.1 peptide/nickel transport system permease protein [Pseudomonas sp. NFPP15]SEL24034.1 peptide/nickel transport system permease protein [Pseudomonas sp. NFPP18]SFA64171.1 peptide/nickel transport system permease protein [Pseudomonas sp. NFPP13]SFT94330.1 peptide/nickel transport system permease protein [Pseudomonas sp. NFPP25]
MNSLCKLLLQRLALGLLSLLAVSVIIFLAVGMLPGDVAQAMLGQAATPETVAAFRAQLGLDLPPLTRFGHWAWQLLHGDLGLSLANQRPIAELIGTRLGNTFTLALLAALVSVPVALLLGMLAALYRNSWFDRLLNTSALSAVSFPEFFVAYILILVFAVKLNWLPSISNLAPGASFAEVLERSLLPVLTLSLVVVAQMMRMTRAALINVLASPYIEMARLKGVSQARIIFHHALPNALAPIINVVALNLAYLVVGVVVVEVVFVYPGLGQLLVDSVSKRDIPVVQACSLIFAATYILLNTTADVLSIASNPRLMNPKG